MNTLKVSTIPIVVIPLSRTCHPLTIKGECMSGSKFQTINRPRKRGNSKKQNARQTDDFYLRPEFVEQSVDLIGA